MYTAKAVVRGKFIGLHVYMRKKKDGKSMF